MGKIAYSMSDPDETPRQKRQNPYPLLPKGMRNTSIDHDLLMRIPLRFRMRWPFYDLQKMFAEEIIEESNPELPELTDVRKRTDVMPDLNKLSQDKKDELRAIALGELSREEYEKKDPLWDIEDE